MKKEFINPELEVLRFQNGVDMISSSTTQQDESPQLMNSGYSTGSKSLSRGVFDNSVD